MTETAETARQVKPIWKCGVNNCNFTYPPTLKGYRQMLGHQLKHANEGVPKAKRGFQIVDETTGEILAQKLEEALAKGFIATKPPEPEAKQPEPAKVEPAKVEPPKVEPPKVEPPKVEPAKVEPAKVEPAKVEPAKVEPAKVEPAKVEPAKQAEPKAKGEKEGEITTPQTSSDGIFRYTITLPADAFTLFNLAKTCGLEKDSEKPFDEWLWDCIRMRYKTDYKMRLVLAPEEK